MRCVWGRGEGGEANECGPCDMSGLDTREASAGSDAGHPLEQCRQAARPSKTGRNRACAVV